MKDEDQIEMSIKDAEKIIDLSNALDRLMDNPDFKRIIVEGYFKDNAVRLVHSLGEPAIAHVPEHKQRVIGEMDAISCLRGFFDQIHRNASSAEQAIERNREELEYLRTNGDDE